MWGVDCGADRMGTPAWTEGMGEGGWSWQRNEWGGRGLGRSKAVGIGAEIRLVWLGCSKATRLEGMGKDARGRIHGSGSALSAGMGMWAWAWAVRKARGGEVKQEEVSNGDGRHSG